MVHWLVNLLLKGVKEHRPLGVIVYKYMDVH